MLLTFPLLLIVVLGYNAVVFSSETALSQVLFQMTMVSGADWAFTLSDLIVTFALLCLFAEILKATRTHSVSIIDHGLSTILFIGCLVEFLLVREAGTSTFFLITMTTLIDVIAGYSVTIRSARRDFTVGGGGGGGPF